MSDDWSHEETDDPGYADRRNFHKVENGAAMGQRINEMLFAGNSAEQAIGCRTTCRLYYIPQLRLCIRGNAGACIGHRPPSDGRSSDHLSLVFP